MGILRPSVICIAFYMLFIQLHSFVCQLYKFLEVNFSNKMYYDNLPAADSQVVKEGVLFSSA